MLHPIHHWVSLSKWITIVRLRIAFLYIPWFSISALQVKLRHQHRLQLVQQAPQQVQQQQQQVQLAQQQRQQVQPPQRVRLSLATSLSSLSPKECAMRNFTFSILL